MPSSRPNTIPTVVHLIRQLRPQSILDVGVGFGKWGHLFREYTDIQEAEHDPARYQRQNWKVRIDGIEGFSSYITDMHRYLYNEIHIGNACDLMPNLPRYDLVFMGDIIEHLEKTVGMHLLQSAFEKANKAVIVSTPKYETEQADLCGNELERHRSLWSADDFRTFGSAVVKTIDQDTLIAVLRKPGVPDLVVSAPMQPRPEDAAHLRTARDEIQRVIPASAPFILVDQEQIRTELAGRQAIPFLENEGQYWGPPPNDYQAIVECERMQKEGAKFIAFVWSTFWWLEHYSIFATYLRSHHRCIFESPSAIVFQFNT